MNLQTFTLADFTASQTAARLGLKNQPNTTQETNLRALWQAVLVPLAKGLSTAQSAARIQISSGFRSPAVNAKVGGSSSSQHCSGQAVDFTVEGFTVSQVCDWVLAHPEAFPKGWDQLIHEFGSWVHISFRADGINRNQALRAIRVKGPLGLSKVVYTGY